jgi:sugar/nucleoside kinase (ribokinase family)
MRILVVGSVGLDTIRTPYTYGDHILGGSAVHFANAASLLAKRIDLVGVVGEDFTEEHIAFLKSRKTDVKGLMREKGKTFHWEGYYEKDMNQAFTVKTDLNVFSSFNPIIPDEYKNDPIVFLANIDPDLQLQVLENMPHAEFKVCDTMNYWITGKKKSLLNVISKVDCAVFNDAEIRQLTGISNIQSAVKEILSKGPKTIIVKRGEYGFLVVSRDNVFAGPAMVLENVVDPTGAGDSFAGGFISYLSWKKSFDFKTIRKAVVYANIVASFNVQGLGVDGIASIAMKDLRKRIKEYENLVTFGRIL